MKRNTSKLKESLDLLKKNGWVFDKDEAGTYSLERGRFFRQDGWTMTARELISFARGFGKECKQKTKVKKDTKRESKSERAFVRDELRKRGEDADTNFPKRAFSDTWSWD